MKISRLLINCTILSLTALSFGCQNNKQATNKSASTSVSTTNKQAKPKRVADDLQSKKNKFIFSGTLTKKDKEELAKMNIAAFGDSVMEGCKDDYQKMFPKIQIDAGVSRQASSLPSELAGKNLPDTILIGLGTNGPFSQKQYDQIMKTLGQRQVYWINTNVYKDWRQDVNIMLLHGSQKYKNAHVINWYQYCRNHDDWFWDGIHPNIEGRQKMVDFVGRNLIADEKFK